MVNKRILVAPSHKTMDHIPPAVRFSGAGLVILVPLHEAVEGNVKKFGEEVLTDKIHKESLNCEVLTVKTPPGEKDTWEQVWRSWLLSAHLIEGVPEKPEISVVLNPDLPLGLILSTATTSLSLPSLKIFEIPSGYNVRRKEEDYNPGSPLSDQAIQYNTWSQEGIAAAFMNVAKADKLAMVLQVARLLAVRDRENKSYLLEEKEINRGDMKEELEKMGFIPSDSSLSNLLKRARGIDLNTRNKIHEPLIINAGKQSTYKLTALGVIVTSLLENQ